MSDDEITLFQNLGLHPQVLAGIEALGFESPTPIQQQSIPVLLEGHDLIGKANTGTGKTLAFTAPMLGRLDPERVAVQAIVLCPTRELAQQVEETARTLGASLGLRSALVVGGIHEGGQILALRGGAQIVVGTPGRVLDFLGKGTLRLGWVSQVVLDEADRMLDMGFIDDVTRILEHVPRERQMAMFSATIPPDLKKLSKRFLKDPKTVSITTGMSTTKNITQHCVFLHPGDKEGYILDLLDANPEDTCIIFCNTRREVIELDRLLWGMGYAAGSLHGDHDQERRFQVLEAFKKKGIRTLVATDVAARGLDIESVTRVVNYDVPDEVDTYVHRIGRTARAGESGDAITLVSRKEEIDWKRIIARTGFSVGEVDWSPSRPRSKRSESFHSRGRGGPPGRAGRMAASRVKRKPARASSRREPERSKSPRRGRNESPRGGRRDGKREPERDRGRPRDDRPGRGRGGRPRDERPRDERPRDERPRDERERSDRPKSDRPRDDRPRGGEERGSGRGGGRGRSRDASRAGRSSSRGGSPRGSGDRDSRRGEDREPRSERERRPRERARRNEESRSERGPRRERGEAPRDGRPRRESQPKRSQPRSRSRRRHEEPEPSRSIRGSREEPAPTNEFTSRPPRRRGGGGGGRRR